MGGAVGWVGLSSLSLFPGVLYEALVLKLQQKLRQRTGGGGLGVSSLFAENLPPFEILNNPVTTFPAGNDKSLILYSLKLTSR